MRAPVHCQAEIVGLGCAKAPGLDDRKRDNMTSNMVPLTIVQPRKLSRGIIQQFKLGSVLVVLLLFACSSCWRMPNEDDVSVLPATNNPTLTHQNQSAPWMPGADY